MGRHQNQQRRQKTIERVLALGAFGLIVGIILSFWGEGTLGGLVAIAAAVALVVGIHVFGRLGADGPMQFAAARSRPDRNRVRKKRGHLSSAQ